MGILHYIRRQWLRARWERFSDRARAAMACANRKALEMQAPAIGEEHLLAAIVEEGSGVGAALLRYVGVGLDELRLPVVAAVPWRQGPRGEPAKLPLDRAVERAVRRAIDAAITLGDDYVGTEHLVLGLAGGRSEALTRALAAGKLTPDGLRDSLRALRQLWEGERAPSPLPCRVAAIQRPDKIAGGGTGAEGGASR
jgi:ATP-dependent Clp protease ATP-binding subunit ClpA